MIGDRPNEASPTPARSGLAGPLGFLAVALPFGLAVARAASSAQWRDDLSAVRDLGLVAVGAGGGISTAVAQLFGLLPLGSKAFRAALGSTVALAIGARLLFQLSLRVVEALAGDGPLAKPTAPGALPAPLGAGAPGPHLAALIAAITTLTAALSPTWQREATVGGGAAWSIAAVLATLVVATRVATVRAARHAEPAHASVWLSLGALVGASLAESPPAGVVAALAVVAILAADAVPRPLLLLVRAADTLPRIPLPSPRVLVASVATAIAVAALLLAPAALRPLSPRAWVDLGRMLSASSLSALDVASARTTALAAWIGEVGFVSLAVAALGALAALRSARARPLLAALAILVVADTVMPARVAGVLSADPLTSLRSLAVAALAVASAAGVAAAVGMLVRSRVPLAKSAAVLVVVFHLTLVALASEEAGFVSDRSEQHAAEAWTDDTYLALEPSAAVLVRSPALAWRLWAARVVRGERPDVLVVPVPLLDRGRVALSLYEADRRIEPLLRAYALTAEPTEFAMSKVADVRPLHVELDRSWSRRIALHLAVDGLWLEYAPQPLGPSDRKMSSLQATARVARVLAAANSGSTPDASTTSIVATTLRQQAAALTAAGERDEVLAFQKRIADLSTSDPFRAGDTSRFAFVGVARAFTAK